MTEKKKNGSGGKTRREFLKDAGLLVGGTAIGSTVLLAACGGTETETVTNTVTRTTTVAESKFVCPIDGMEFDSLAELQAHFEAEHAAAEAPGLAILHVNGNTFYTKVKSNWTLAYVLREKMGLTGTKVACEKGDCGVCTVIMDGRPVLSCLVLAVEAQGKAIQTVEGLAGSDGTLDPLQKAFIKNDALQCGFCTPGQLMNAKALLGAKPNPSRDEAREYMAGTLCRCGAQPAIIDSILEVAG
jgi:aerobic-type carbon monoxide dehydrogenase small subunit (CoxS/CutS family)